MILSFAVALYFENQNHMFSELLFLRYLQILKVNQLSIYYFYFHTLCNCVILQHHSTHVLDHLKGVHEAGQDRVCCHKQAEILHEIFRNINDTFGNDIFATITILVISIVFGFYLLMTFTLFIPGGTMWAFLMAYALYSIIPSVR